MNNLDSQAGEEIVNLSCRLLLPYKHSENDQLVECPYVPSHRVSRGEPLQEHLLACRRRCLLNSELPWYAKAEAIEICRFNACHHVLKVNMQDHLKTCHEAMNTSSKTRQSGPTDDDEIVYCQWLPYKRSGCSSAAEEGDGSSSAAEELVQCPYVPDHKLRRGHRLQTHLIKCQRYCLMDSNLPWHNKAKTMVICQYNACHHVVDKNMSTHLKTCNEYLQKQWERREAKRSVRPVWLSSIPPVNSGDGVNPGDGGNPGEEDWDAPTTQPNTDVLEAIGQRQDLNIIPPGLLPLERRLFRRERRLHQ